MIHRFGGERLRAYDTETGFETGFDHFTNLGGYRPQLHAYLG